MTFSASLCGFAAIMLVRFRGWRRIRAAVRSSTPIDVLETMQVRSSPGLLERDLTLPRKLALAFAGVAALMTPIVVGSAATPKFEAASIKACDAFRKGTFPMYSPGTLLHSQCTTEQRLIQQAYGLFANGRWNPGSSLAVTGGPAWTTSALYRIDAKAASSQSRAMLNGPMLQTLLEDRLRLKLHRETREVAVYALTVATGGAKLQPFQGSCIARDFDKPPSEMDCGTAQAYSNGFAIKAATMDRLCTVFSVLLDRPIIDETGIAGRFNLRLDLPAAGRGLLNRPRSLPAVSDPTAPAPPPVPFSAAKGAVEKLGLNLEPSKGPIEVLVIDHVERPSGN